jgi:predicted alpha/beta hydrolase
MRGFEANWLDWGSKDFEGVLQFAATRYNGHSIRVAAHSIGGCLVGMAPSNHLIERVFTMGSQFAYWRDFAKHKRFAMYLRWHVVMPTLTALFGYFPSKRLGWLEDTPRGVVQDWVAPHPRVEDIYKAGSQVLSQAERAQLVESFARLTGPTLALSVADDEFGTIPAIHRLLAYYRNSPSLHMRIEPGAIGQKEIGHFAFFNSRYSNSLWRIPLAWLRDGKLTDEVPGQLIAVESNP